MSFDQLLDWLNQNPEWFLFGVFLTAFSESLAVIGLIMPGAFLMFALMVMAGNQDFSLQWVLLWAFSGAVLGDAVSFYFGRLFKHKIPNLWPFYKKPQWLEQGKIFFKQHGGKSIFIGRFVGPVRPIIPMVAGMLSMNSSLFFIVNILSAIGWAICYVLPGYIIGSAMRLDIDLPDNFKTVFLITTVFIFSFLALAVWLYQNLHPEKSLYRSFERTFRTTKTLRYIWQNLSSPRTDDPSFPLASLMTFAICLSLFLGWVLWVDTFQHPLNVDLILLDLTKQLHSASEQAWLVALTMLGDPNLLYSCAACFALYLAIRKQFGTLILIAMVTFISYTLVTLMKETFLLSRPELLVQPFSGYSFPSGHTVGATVYFGLIASFLAQEQPPKKRWPYYGTALLLSIIVGMSRVLLGVHWLSDVVCGILLGISIVALARLAYSPFNQAALTLRKKDLWLPALLLANYISYYVLQFQTQYERYIWLDLF